MQGEELIIQLQKFLPKFTDKFSSNIAIASITSSALLATATTSAAHGLSTGNVVNIVGALSPVAITSISRSGTVATVTTTDNHDLTDKVFPTVTLSGTSEAIFNGTFTFLNQVNRKTFTFTVADSGATIATGGQLEDPGAAGGYDGLVAVTVISTTVFTYALILVQSSAAIVTNAQVRQAIRITGAVDLDRAKVMYTKQSTDDFWAFVILEDVIVSKDRHGFNDANSSEGSSGSRRQQIIQPFIVIVYAPATDDLSGRLVRDDMEAIAPAMYQSLVQFKPDTGLAEGANMGVTFVGSGTIEYATAYYAYGFRFELLANIENADTIEHSFDVAFRDISLTMSTNLGTGILTASLDLDDEPLP